MTAAQSSQEPPKRITLFRKLALGAGIIIALLVLLYFTMTSSAFVKSFVIPRIGNALGANLTVAEVSLSPFSQVNLKKVRVQTTGSEPLLTAEEIKVRYNLLSILRGNIEIQEITLLTPSVHIAMEADGKSNLDSLLKKGGAPAGKTAKPSEPVRLNLQNVGLKDGKVRMVTQQKEGGARTIELENLNLTLDRLRNGGSGKINVAADLKYERSAGASKTATTDRAQAKISGGFELGLDSQLVPRSVKGNARLDLARAEGAFKDLSGLVGFLEADATATEIRQLALRFERGGKGLGNILASGPFNSETLETRLKLQVQSIDRQVLNIAGAAHGWDFADSILNSTNTVELTRKGSVVAASGTVAGSRLGIRQASGATPPVDLNLDYQVTVNLDQKTAVIQKLELIGKENQKDLLRASLDRPMSLNWGASTTSIPDSTLQLALRDFNLLAWRAVLGTNLPSGRVNLQLTVQAQQEGKRLNTKLAGDIQDLSAQVGTNRIDQAQARFELTGKAEDLRIIDLDQYRIELLQKSQVVAQSSGSAHYDLSSGEISVKTDLEASLPDLLKTFPIPNLTAAAGRIKSTSTFTQKNQQQTATGQLLLASFTGRYGEYRLQDFQTALDYGVDIAPGLVQIRRANATFRQSDKPNGSVDLAGRYHLTNNSAQMTFKLADLNQQLLLPFLSPSLGEWQLVSILLSGQGSASYDPKGESSVQGEIKMGNLDMNDRRRKLPRTPLDARLQVNGSLRRSEVEVRQLVFDVTRNNASAGHLDLQGKFNLTNYAGAGTFKLADFDQTALRPILAASLGENELVSVALNGSGSAGYDPKGDSVVKAELKVANLVVADPKKKLPATPLSAEMQVDSSIRKQVVELRQFALKLAPTDRAQNQLHLQGRLDLSPSNATPSQLLLQADSLDLTPYYDLFAGTAGTNQPPPKPQPAAASASEPAAVDLPVQQMTVDLKVNRCYLRDLAVTNLLATAQINRGEISLKPLQFALNGAPVNANAVLNLGVPGYKYDLAFKADRLPLEPLVSSFSRDHSSRLQGLLLADAQIKGAGVTGASLQKNLSGQVSLSLTNLNWEIVGKKTKALLEPIALVLRLPELTQTPLDWVSAKADLGQGKINVGQFSVRSPALFANGQGTVQLAAVLTNSPLDIPVAIALRRSLAEKAHTVPAGSPTNTAYVQLPTFAKLAGTLGDPKTEIDKLVISGLLLQSAGSIPKLGDKTGNVLQGIGGILSGQKPALPNTNAPPSPNSSPASRTNKPPKLNPLDLLELIPKKK